MVADRFAEYLARVAEQIATLESFMEAQRLVYSAVQQKDWTGLELAVKQAGAWATMVAGADQARESAWRAWLEVRGLPVSCGLRTALKEMPEDIRKLVNERHRVLRMAARRAKAENDALTTFVDRSASSLTAAIQALFPERKVKIYSRSGRQRDDRNGALVLDQAF